MCECCWPNMMAGAKFSNDFISESRFLESVTGTLLLLVVIGLQRFQQLQVLGLS